MTAAKTATQVSSFATIRSRAAAGGPAACGNARTASAIAQFAIWLIVNAMHSTPIALQTSASPQVKRAPQRRFR